MNKLTEEELKTLYTLRYGRSPTGDSMDFYAFRNFNPVDNPEQFLGILKKLDYEQRTLLSQSLYHYSGYAKSFGPVQEAIWIMSNPYEVLKAILAVLGEA